MSGNGTTLETGRGVSNNTLLRIVVGLALLTLIAAIVAALTMRAAHGAAQVTSTALSGEVATAAAQR